MCKSDYLSYYYCFSCSSVPTSLTQQQHGLKSIGILVLLVFFCFFLVHAMKSMGSNVICQNHMIVSKNGRIFRWTIPLIFFFFFLSITLLFLLLFNLSIFVVKLKSNLGLLGSAHQIIRNWPYSASAWLNQKYIICHVHLQRILCV